MAFTSYEFLLFFFLVFILYWATRERRWQNILLLAASYYFYASLHVGYAALLGFSTTADFLLARGMVTRPEQKRLFLTLSLILNLGVLALFKYANFFIPEVNAFLTLFKLDSDLTRILLPAGLSFFTLKKLGYLLDVSRGTLKPPASFINFALYVSFFPQLVAGPIERAQTFMPQVENARTWQGAYFQQAFPLILMGFFKKLVVANSIQILVDRIFSLAQPSGLLLFTGGLGYTLQIFADFSAYTDLSRGFAFLLGFSTMENFRNPYGANTPTDFWNRWHISLSTWFRDYVFFPVRRALMRCKINESLTVSLPPLITMFISGLWHGAGSNFILWGLYYGVLIVGYQLAGIRGDWKPASKITAFFAWLLMFLFIVAGWVIFRVSSLEWLANSLLYVSFIPSKNELVLVLITLTAVCFYSLPLIVEHWIVSRNKDTWLYAAFYAFAAAITIVYINSTNSDFIYFQF